MYFNITFILGFHFDKHKGHLSNIVTRGAMTPNMINIRINQFRRKPTKKEIELSNYPPLEDGTGIRRMPWVQC